MWDVFFVEGMDVLFRVALAMLRMNEADLLQCDSVSSLYIHLESMTTRMWHPDKLLKVSVVWIFVLMVVSKPGASDLIHMS